MRDEKPFEVFVNQSNPLTDGWSKPLTPQQAADKIECLIGNKIAGAVVKIPVEIMMQFKDMHICFPGTVCSVENSESTDYLDGWFEYHECTDGGAWQIRVTWEGDRHRKKVELEEITEDVVMTLQKFSAIIRIAVEGVKKQPTLDEINKKMWDLVDDEVRA